jgi:iron complex transport system substrate-binding protein
MKRNIALLVAIAIIFSGCLSASGGITPPANDGTFPITVTDDSGQNVTITTPPERIISLAPSNTEILFAIGLGEKIVGVTEYCNYPEAATRKEKIGGFKTVNIEKVVSLNPDLVLGAGGVQAEAVKKLRELGITVVILDAGDMDEILDNILLVGRITGSELEAEKLVFDLGARIQAVKSKSAGRVEKQKVAYILWGDPLMVAGADTFVNDLIGLAGGENVFSDSKVQYPTIALEGMIERDPEILINGDQSSLEISGLKSDPRWMEISSVKNDRLYTIDADIVSRPGPRIVDALELFSLWISGGG